MWSPKRSRAILLAAISIFVFYLGFNITERVREAKQQQEKIEEKRKQERAGGNKIPESGLPFFKEFSFTEYNEGGRYFTLRARSFRIRNKKVRFFRIAMFKEAVMEDVQIEFFKDKEWVSTIKSKQAVMDLTRMVATFVGDVTIKARGGKSLECDRMAWFRKTGVIKVNGSFVYREGSKEVRGIGLYSDNYLTKVDLINSKRN
jgi:hypothetical protein